MEFRILGPLEVVEKGRVLTLGGSRQRTLLALLLTRANEIVSKDRLIDDLWGASAPDSAANALQYHVSQLRKALAPGDAIVTHGAGYLLRVEPEELDLLRFERLVGEARQAPPEAAARLLRQALALWRGPALADLAHEPFAQSEILRLEELRLGALERRIEADLALGRHAEVVGELEALVREHPLRERLRALLMRALYGSGRQADALGVYRETRALLVEELGIDPAPELQELEQAILRQDPALSRPPGGAVPPASPPRRAIMAVTGDDDRIEALLAVAEPLARRPDSELILLRLLTDGVDVTDANAVLEQRRRDLAERGVSCRVAAYTASEPGSEITLAATAHNAELMLVDAPADLLEHGRLDGDLAVLLAGAPCDVGLLAGSGRPGPGPVVTPFGGLEHDWSAIEVAAWLAQSLGTTLRLLGTEADAARGRRDASRLLARASLLVQQVIGIATEPVLVASGHEGVLDGARNARLLVIGLSERWRSEGIGRARLAVAAGAAVPTLFVRRGLRPSGVAPNETLTRFTWTLGSQQVGSES